MNVNVIQDSNPMAKISVKILMNALLKMEAVINSVIMMLAHSNVHVILDTNLLLTIQTCALT